jgi:hypothetical protein
MLLEELMEMLGIDLVVQDRGNENGFYAILQEPHGQSIQEFFAGTSEWRGVTYAGSGNTIMDAARDLCGQLSERTLRIVAGEHVIKEVHVGRLCWASEQSQLREEANYRSIPLSPYYVNRGKVQLLTISTHAIQQFIKRKKLLDGTQFSSKNEAITEIMRVLQKARQARKGHELKNRDKVHTSGTIYLVYDQLRFVISDNVLVTVEIVGELRYLNKV